MPFNPKIFQSNVELQVEGAAQGELAQACQAFAELTTPRQKAHSIQGMMNVLDRELEEKTRWQLMEECGRHCITAGTLEKARRLQRAAQGLDDLLNRLNEAHIGGGHLRREGDIIHAAYERCYCGSVSQTSGLFSATYCHCSCGWYRQLFETLLGRPVKVELLGSIIQGDERCRFLIHLQETG